MTSSPFLTLTGARSPLSRRLPSPTDRTLPRLGFSLAVSGRTMPLFVFDSASTRLTRILSPRGRSFAIAVNSLRKCVSKKGCVSSPGPLSLVIPPQDAGERVEQEVEVDRFAQHAEHVHPERLAEQVRREVGREQDRRRRLAELAHHPDHLKAAELRHLHVEDGHVNRARLDELQRLMPAAGGD